jgi:hypothetical protein
MEESTMSIEQQLTQACAKLDQLILKTPSGDVRDELTEINILVYCSRIELNKLIGELADRL